MYVVVLASSILLFGAGAANEGLFQQHVVAFCERKELNRLSCLYEELQVCRLKY